MMGLMVTSSKRAYAIPRSAVPRALSLQQSTADRTSSRNTQTQLWLSLCGVSGSWWAQGLFEPSERLWQVRGLKFLNTISPPYHLARASHFPLDIAYLFCVGGIQHFPVNGCSAVNCSFRVLAGEDERTSFYSVILCHEHRQRHTQDKVNG